ncbi:MAG: YhcH/YjgK/YiaL family protein [Syntrophobacteraceae bacterium]
MIYDRFENLKKYFHFDSPLERAVSFAAQFDLSKPEGRYAIDADNIYALVSSYETSSDSRGIFEIHRNHVDIHVVLEGEEKIEISLSSDLKQIGDYEEATDRAILTAPKDRAALALRPGCFAVIYPNEAHRPGCDLNGKVAVRKMVVKVKTL